jgi:PAS domain S-box-containing protein
MDEQQAIVSEAIQELAQAIEKRHSPQSQRPGQPKKLERERDRLLAMVENSHTQLAYLDRDFNFVRVSSTYAERSGHTPDELIGRNYFALFPDQDKRVIFERVRRSGKPARFNTQTFDQSSQSQEAISYWNWKLTPLTDETGTFEGLILSLLDVTEREQANAKLAAERARLHAIIQNAPEAIVVGDEKGRIILANPAAKSIYARPIPYGKEIESHLDLSLRYPDGTPYKPRDLPLTRSALNGETFKNLRMTIVWPDGQRRNLLVNTAPIRDRESEIVGAVGIFQDITERKKVEEVVRRYANRLEVLHRMDKAILAARSAEEIAKVAMFHLSNSLPCQRASVELFDFEREETSTLAIYTKGEVSDKPRTTPLPWIHPVETLQAGEPHIIKDVRQLPLSPVTRALQAQGVLSSISVPLLVQGELLGVLNLGLKETGGLAHNDLTMVKDMADQLAIGLQQARLRAQIEQYAQSLEERVAARTAQLRASEERFRTIFEQAAIGIVLIDVDGRLLATNPAIQEILGYSAEELQGRSSTAITHPDDVQTSLDLYEEMIAGERTSYTVEKRYVRKDGEIVWARLVASLVRDPRGAPQYTIGMVEDITEQKKAQRAMIQSEKMVVMGKLAASLAHEINNPLQTVIGCLGLAQETFTDESNEEVVEYVEVAHDELQRAKRIVARLRDLGQPVDSEDRQPTDVNELVERVLKLSRKKCNNNHIEVKKDLAEDLPAVAAIPDRLQQVFLNLVLNAVDAMPEGGHLQIETAYDDQSGELCITFRDDGPGIPPDVRPHIFDPFYSTKSEGMGLGLFVSHNIVEQIKGQIEVESQVGQGCEFTVRLPV